MFDVTVPETICLTIVVLGASGDLAKKKTYPALFQLHSKGSVCLDKIEKCDITITRMILGSFHPMFTFWGMLGRR